jgi:hypothetical protein
VPVDTVTEAWIGVAISANTTAKLYIDDILIQQSEFSKTSTIQSNIPGLQFTTANGTAAPAGGVEFTFAPGKKHRIRVEYQVYYLRERSEKVVSLNAQIELFWNLVDRRDSIAQVAPTPNLPCLILRMSIWYGYVLMNPQAVELSKDADVIVLTAGANWDSDGEGADRSTLSLAAPQMELFESLSALHRPIILILQGGRPFAISSIYARSAAVLNTYFPGQQGGQAISDVLFGKFNPGGRVPVTVPRSVGTLPCYYWHKETARANVYVDEEWAPLYTFGYGLSYTNFSVSDFVASSDTGPGTFGEGDIIEFGAEVENVGSRKGSFVVQIYLLGRVSQVTQAVKQLVAFERVYLEPGEKRRVRLELDVDRYLPVVGRDGEWVLEKGEYTFTFLREGAGDSDQGMNVTLTCV